MNVVLDRKRKVLLADGHELWPIVADDDDNPAIKIEGLGDDEITTMTVTFLVGSLTEIPA